MLPWKEPKDEQKAPRSAKSRGRRGDLRAGFLRDRRGVAAIEFAAILPIVALLALGCFEVPRYVLVVQRLSRTSSGVADLVAQADEPIKLNQINDIFTAGKLMMSPYDVVTNGVIIVSSINNPNGAGVTLTWQSRKGTLSTVSKLGVANTNPSSKIPASLVPGSNEEVIAAEVYFNYTPVFSNLIYSGSQLYRISYTRPRNHNLLSPPS
jgi:Flp pilus assembly protein TadG